MTRRLRRRDRIRVVLLRHHLPSPQQNKNQNHQNQKKRRRSDDEPGAQAIPKAGLGLAHRSAPWSRRSRRLRPAPKVELIGFLICEKNHVAPYIMFFAHDATPHTTRYRIVGARANCDSGEESCALLGQPYERTAFVQPQPTARNGKIEARLVFGWAALVLKQKRPLISSI
jgi:hypothetical protein